VFEVLCVFPDSFQPHSEMILKIMSPPLPSALFHVDDPSIQPFQAVRATEAARNKPAIRLNK
jgi:hypothetical protein